MTGRPRVAVFAYACEPGKGSEPGAGWGLVEALAGFAACTVLHGPEHTEAIRHDGTLSDGVSCRFVEVPEPGWARWAKWHRIPWFLAYLAWLRRARNVAVALHEEEPFDAAHHATYAVYWLPSPATRLGVPSIWGPVGGAVVTPRRLWPLLGWRGLITEVVDLVLVRFAAAWPATRRTWRAATVRVLQNSATARRMPGAWSAEAELLNHAVFAKAPEAHGGERSDHLLWVSPMDARKGPALAVRAMALTPDDVQLVMVGDGPRRRAVERLAQRLGVADRIEFRGWVPRDEAIRLMGTAAAVVFTGLREEGGLALAEAMLVGSPVIVLAHGGARDIAESAVDPSRVTLVEATTVAGTAERLAAAMTDSSRARREPGGPLLDQAAARERIEAIFTTAIAGPGRSDAEPAD